MLVTSRSSEAIATVPAAPPRSRWLSPFLPNVCRVRAPEAGSRRCRRALPAVLCWCAFALLMPMPALGQDTPDYFRQNCISCHTIGGGRLTGPDLKDVTKRQNREWLTKFLLNPRAVIDSGDPYAKKIFEEARNVPMPTPPGITPERADKAARLDRGGVAAREVAVQGAAGLHGAVHRCRPGARSRRSFSERNAWRRAARPASLATACATLQRSVAAG